MSASPLSQAQKEELVSTARTTVGDELRSVTYFTEDSLAQLYLREGFDRNAELVGFAENERLGFRSQRAYRGSELGEYQFTIRAFEYGYLTRVIVGEHGVWVTTGAMHIDRFEDLAHVIEGVLREC